jgi:hypothetical protein
VSPTWHNVKYNKNKNKFEVTGSHDVDQGWMNDVNQQGNKMAPRFHIEEPQSNNIYRNR